MASQVPTVHSIATQFPVLVVNRCICGHSDAHDPAHIHVSGYNLTYLLTIDGARLHLL